MEKKSEGKTRKCLTLLGGRTSLLLCLSLMFQSSYAAGDSTVPEMGNMEIHQIAQQSSTIKGVVKDQKGEPLIGVSIVVKGTTNAGWFFQFLYDILQGNLADPQFFGKGFVILDGKR